MSASNNAMDYSFVKSIGNEGLPDGLLESLRKSVVLGSHADAILKEALLDRPYDKEPLHEIVVETARAGDFILNSFPDRHFIGANLLVRSEFLLLREIGGEKFSFEAMEGYVRKTLGRILPYAPNALIYRCLDYNPRDFNFLPDTSLTSAKEATLDSRGAQRLLDQKPLLDMDLRLMQRFLENGLSVDVLVPFVQFPSQIEALFCRMQPFLSDRRSGEIRFGMMIEVPANLYQIAFFDKVDFFIFGPSDLLKYFYGGIDRNDRVFEQVSTSLLTEPVHFALQAIENLGGKEVFFAKSLIDLVRCFDHSNYPTTTFRTLYMPDQIAGLKAWQLGDKRIDHRCDGQIP
jgi:hypothetical protein